MEELGLKLLSLCFQLWCPPNNGDDWDPSFTGLSSITYERFLIIWSWVLPSGITTLSGLLTTGIGQPKDTKRSSINYNNHIAINTSRNRSCYSSYDVAVAQIPKCLKWYIPCFLCYILLHVKHNHHIKPQNANLYKLKS